MSGLLFFNTEVSENFTKIVTLSSVGVIALLILLLSVLCCTKKINTRETVAAGMAVSSSFVLSFIKITPVQYGGSVTLASFVPLLLYTYFYGFMDGLMAGLVFGLLQFIQSPYILTPATFTLDYVLAFTSIGAMGFFKKAFRSRTANLLTGTVAVYALRFTMHFLSGIIYFAKGIVSGSLPAGGAVTYSLLYQMVYLIPDLIICLVVLLILSKAKILDKITPEKNAEE